MHWFSRAFGASVCSLVVFLGVIYVGSFLDMKSGLVPPLAFLVISCNLIAIMLFRGGLQSETSCRNCGHTLRNLTEPRCPACGESI